MTYTRAIEQQPALLEFCYLLEILWNRRCWDRDGPINCSLISGLVSLALECKISGTFAIYLQVYTAFTTSESSVAAKCVSHTSIPTFALLTIADV